LRFFVFFAVKKSGGSAVEEKTNPPIPFNKLTRHDLKFQLKGELRCFGLPNSYLVLSMVRYSIFDIRYSIFFRF